MSKVIFEFEGDEDFDIALCSRRKEIAKMLKEIRAYVRSLFKYEDREQLPTPEVLNKLDDIIRDWYSIEDLEE